MPDDEDLSPPPIRPVENAQPRSGLFPGEPDIFGTEPLFLSDEEIARARAEEDARLYPQAVIDTQSMPDDAAEHDETDDPSKAAGDAEAPATSPADEMPAIDTNADRKVADEIATEAEAEAEAGDEWTLSATLPGVSAAANITPPPTPENESADDGNHGGTPPPGAPLPGDDPSSDRLASFADIGRMGLGDHISELRRRLIATLATLGGIFMLGMIFYTQLWNLAMMPRDWAFEGTTIKAFDILGLGPLDGFVSVVTLALYLALIIGMPMVLYQTWAFIAPGLTPVEKKASVPIFLFGSALFLTGVAIAFRMALPMGLFFLLDFNATLPGRVDQWTMEKYIGFITMGCLGFGVCFETPMVMMALARFRIITPNDILKYWRHALMAMVVMGAVFTPPDPITMIFLSCMLFLLYFGGYFLACWVAPRAPRD